MNNTLTVGWWIAWILGALGWWAVCGGTAKEAGGDAIHATMIIGGIWISHKIYAPGMKLD